ncbi:MAG: hypothetical protein OXN17_15665 [Candidatus Poribacteria bacterium]|nr:hypothetical protein [Candidatus Poribacteria bacterium]
MVGNRWELLLPPEKPTLHLLTLEKRNFQQRRVHFPTRRVPRPLCLDWQIQTGGLYSYEIRLLTLGERQTNRDENGGQCPPYNALRIGR